MELLFLFKVLVFTNFRGVSKTPGTSIIDHHVTLVNGLLLATTATKKPIVYVAVIF